MEDLLPKDSFPLTDEEFIAESLRVVSEYISSHTGSDINFNRCLERVLEETRRIYWRCRKYSLTTKGAMSFSQFVPTEEYNEILERIQDQLCERVEKRIRSLVKSRKLSEIKSTTAIALISGYMHERGYTYCIESQAHRAKLYVKIGNDKVLVFYVRYKDIAVGLLDNILDSVMNIIKQITDQNLEIQIVRARYAACVDWKQ